MPAGWVTRLPSAGPVRSARRPARHVVGPDAARRRRRPVRAGASAPIVEAMRTEVTCGQYLDMVAQAHPLEAGSGDRR